MQRHRNVTFPDNPTQLTVAAKCLPSGSGLQAHGQLLQWCVTIIACAKSSSHRVNAARRRLRVPFLSPLELVIDRRTSDALTRCVYSSRSAAAACRYLQARDDVAAAAAARHRLLIVTAAYLLNRS